MCCEECPRYERCEENNQLKDNCCRRCPDYYDCVDTDGIEKDIYRDPYGDNYNQDYF